MNKTALNTLIKQLEHRIELAEKKKQEEDGLFGEMSYHFVMAGLQTAIEDAKQLLEMEKEQIMKSYDIGSNEGYDLAKIDDIEEGHYMKEAIEYYNEIFTHE